jgi:UDP-GlcNAc3NAcA epimerase
MRQCNAGIGILKIGTIVGARPQFIKAATISRRVAVTEGVSEFIIHTGQHFDENMSDVFFAEMDIPKPLFNLGIASLGHGAMTGRMLEGIEEILVTEQPDVVLVYGDTNSTLAGALAAAKLNIPVAHVESGLRSFNRRMPEEINRKLTDQISDLLFCPTQIAKQNLLQEGHGGDYTESQIVVTGDVMFDAFKYYRKECKAPIFASKVQGAGFCLATIHRQENVRDSRKLGQIVEALNQVHREVQVICPLHPSTKKVFREEGIVPEFTIYDPVSYLEMLWLLTRCELVLTDSGGLQKEAYFAEKSCITLRDETEWLELVETGANKLVGSVAEKIVPEALNAMSEKAPFVSGLYGKGDAADVVLQNLLSSYS